MSALLLISCIITIHLCTLNRACTPCSISELGSIDLNTEDAWSLVGDQCIGHTENDKEISGTFYISLQVNTSHSDPNYYHSLLYLLAIYNDDSMSFPSLNSSMSCLQKLNKTKVIKEIKFESNTFFTEIPIAEPITRQWWVFLTHCVADLNDNNIIYPIIDFNITLTLSSYVIKREQTCDGHGGGNQISLGIIVGIFCAVIVLLVIGGLLIWGCDVYKRKRIRDHAMAQGLILQQEDDDDGSGLEQDKNDQHESNDNNDAIAMKKDDIQLQTA